MKKLLSLVGIAVLLTSCTLDKKDTVADTKEVKIGVIAPLSGAASAYGQDAVNAAQMVIDEANQKNTNTKFVLVPEDGACSGQQAVSAVQKLINIDKVEVIMGGLCSPETINAGKIAQTKGVTMVSALSSAPEVSKIGDHVFRFYNDLDAAKTVAAELKNMNAKKIGAIYVNNEYGNSYIQAVDDLFDGQIVLNEKINSEEKDFALLAKKVAKEAPNLDALIVVIIDESANVSLIKALDAEGLLKTLKGKIIGSEAVITDAILKQVGKLADGIKSIQFPELKNLGGKSAEFLAEYKKSHTVGSSDVFIVLLGEATRLIIDTVNTVGNDGDAIATSIHSIDRSHARNGIFGSYYFDGSDAQALNFVVRTVQDGKLQ